MTPATSTFMPLRQRDPVFESRDVDEVRDYLGETHEGFDVRNGLSDDFFMGIHARRLQHMTVCYIRSGAPVSVTMTASRRDFSLMMPLRWRVEAQVGHDQVVCGDRYAVIGSPSIPEFIATEGENDRAWVSFDSGSLSRLAATLLGDPPTEPIVFAPMMDLRSGLADTLLRSMAFGIGEMVRDDSAFHQPVMQEQFERLIMTALLLSHPNNYSERLNRLDRQISPRDVKKVEDYIHAHFDQSVSLEDLVVVSGVPGRTLHQHFRDFKGVSPMAYLRNVRLDRAREALLQADGEARITDIAMESGFNHLGRFSIQYRERFGESPSETADRSKRSG